jgi:hypothetical protein
MGYGCVISGAGAGRARVALGPSAGGRRMLDLIRDLNSQIGPAGAVIGVDAVNRRLVLSAPEGGI